jgi:hypothetical protein
MLRRNIGQAHRRSSSLTDPQRRPLTCLDVAGVNIILPAEGNSRERGLRGHYRRSGGFTGHALPVATGDAVIPRFQQCDQ